MNKIKAFLAEIKKEKIINKFKIIINIIAYIFFKTISKDRSTERLLLKKVFLKTSLKWFPIYYYFELLTFLYNFETKEYLSIVLDKKYDILIDIWSNIWRISRISILHNKNHEQTHILCDPNPYVFKLSKDFYTKKLEKKWRKVCFINSAISDTRSNIPFYMIEWDECNWVSSLHEENIAGQKIKKIMVESISFKEIIDKIDISNKQILIKIDVEWHENKELESIIDFFGKSNLSNIELLVEIREKNVRSILTIIEKSWYFGEFKKVSQYDYFIRLKK